MAAATDALNSIHGKIKSHINKVVDALKTGSNSTKLGAVSGALLTGDVSKARNVVPVSQIVKNATNTLNAMAARWAGMAPGVAAGAVPRTGLGKGLAAPAKPFATRSTSYGKLPASTSYGKLPASGTRGGQRAGAGGDGQRAGAGDGSMRPDGAVETRRGRMMMPAPGN